MSQYTESRYTLLQRWKSDKVYDFIVVLGEERGKYRCVRSTSNSRTFVSKKTSLLSGKDLEGYSTNPYVEYNSDEFKDTGDSFLNLLNQNDGSFDSSVFFRLTDVGRDCYNSRVSSGDLLDDETCFKFFYDFFITGYSVVNPVSWAKKNVPDDRGDIPVRGFGRSLKSVDSDSIVEVPGTLFLDGLVDTDYLYAEKHRFYTLNGYTPDLTGRVVFFHGTPSKNVYQILTTSLRNSGDGMMFGRGVYLAKNIEKSLNYSNMSWGKRAGVKALPADYVLLVSVPDDMIVIPATAPYDYSDRVRDGYMVWARRGTHLANDEIVVDSWFCRVEGILVTDKRYMKSQYIGGNRMRSVVSVNSRRSVFSGSSSELMNMRVGDTRSFIGADGLEYTVCKTSFTDVYEVVKSIGDLYDVGDFLTYSEIAEGLSSSVGNTVSFFRFKPLPQSVRLAVVSEPIQSRPIYDKYREIVKDILQDIRHFKKVPNNQNGIKKEVFGKDHVCYMWTEKTPLGAKVSVEFHTDPRDGWTEVYVIDEFDGEVSKRLVIPDLEDIPAGIVDDIEEAVGMFDETTTESKRSKSKQVYKRLGVEDDIVEEY